MFWKTLKAIKMKIAENEMEESEALAIRARMSLMPHQQWPVTVTREGSKWVCSYPCHPDPLQCVTAYGDSPGQACSNFDSLWHQTDGLIDSPEDEEEF